jgi:hypothetical protein
VNLTEFIHRTERFGCLVAQVIFDKDGASIDVGPHEQRGIWKLNLHVNCEPLVYQRTHSTRHIAYDGGQLRQPRPQLLWRSVGVAYEDTQQQNASYTADGLQRVVVGRCGMGEGLDSRLSVTRSTITRRGESRGVWSHDGQELAVVRSYETVSRRSKVKPESEVAVEISIRVQVGVTELQGVRDLVRVRHPNTSLSIRD